MEVSFTPVNRQFRVSYQAGLIGALAGESQGAALERVMDEMNDQGYRVVFIVPDRMNVFRRLFHIAVAVVTLGLFYTAPNLLIVGEWVGDRED